MYGEAGPTEAANVPSHSDVAEIVLSSLHLAWVALRGVLHCKYLPLSEPRAVVKVYLCIETHHCVRTCRCVYYTVCVCVLCECVCMCQTFPLVCFSERVDLNLSCIHSAEQPVQRLYLPRSLQYTQSRTPLIHTPDTSLNRAPFPTPSIYQPFTPKTTITQ